MSITTLILVVAIVILAVGLAAAVLLRTRRTGRLRSQFGGTEYDRAVKEGGNQRKGETELDKRAERVEGFKVQPLTPADRTRFETSWHSVQARFVDTPGGAVAEADQLLRDVMSVRGYPMSDFEQRAADISVDHPNVMTNYRAAHEIAVRQTNGQAGTEDLRQAMIHYRSLFEELVSEQDSTLREAV
ncbi:MAG: hypothetical protein WBX15_05550 [Thermoanaerobaculia bacterium]